MSILEQMLQALRPLQLYTLAPEGSVYAELSAYAQCLERVQQRLSLVLQEAFLQTASESRLAAWERLLTLPPAQLSLSERRERLLQRFSQGAPDPTPGEIQTLLEAAGFTGTLEEDAEAQTIRLLWGPGAESLAGCSAAVRAIELALPAQLKIWADLPAQDWDALDASARTFDSWDALALRWELQEEDTEEGGERIAQQLKNGKARPESLGRS